MSCLEPRGGPAEFVSLVKLGQNLDKSTIYRVFEEFQLGKLEGFERNTVNPNKLRAVPVRNWRSRFLVGMLAVTLGSASFASPASASDPQTQDDSWQAAAEAASASPAELKAEVADGELRMIVVRDDQGEPDVTVVSVTNAKQLDQTLTAVAKDPSVISIDVDRKVNLLGSNASPTVAATAVTAYNQWNYTALQLHQIHAHHIGSGVITAVIDSGVNRTGTDLNNPGQVLDGCDWVTSPTNVCRGTGVVDENGHGTHVAGIIAAQDDGEGITGVAPGSVILPLRVLDASGAGYLSDISAAIDYAVTNNADVINMSLGGPDDYYLIKNAVDNALSAGVIVVAAAGNSGPNNTLPSYPAAYESVIAVAATDSNGVVANYSNQGSYLDISAPGSAIISTYGSGYASLSGTSMASPHIAGVVALMLESGILPSAIKAKLQSTADNSAPRNVQNRYGAGLVNAYNALDCNGVTCSSPSQTPSASPSPTTVIANTTLVNPGVVASPTAPAPEVTQAPSPVVTIPTLKESLVVTKAKRKISINVTAPSGSKTWVQRKSGKKWKTVMKFTTVPSVSIKVGRAGTYRVKIIAPNESVTTKAYKIK